MGGMWGIRCGKILLLEVGLSMMTSLKQRTKLIGWLISIDTNVFYLLHL